MIVLLPPSETKLPGGDSGTRLDWTRLALPELTEVRRAVARDLALLVEDPDDAHRALKLGPRQLDEVQVDRELATSPTLPALDRFTGVLYDALDAPTLGAAARERAGERVLIASALFGAVGALDPIPAYRLGPDARLPGASLRARWRAPLAAALGAIDDFVLDLRSESYRVLGPLPTGDRMVAPRLVAESEGGVRRALNHFNKAGKGRLLRQLLESGAEPGDAAELRAWLAAAGWRSGEGADGVLEIVVDERAS